MVYSVYLRFCRCCVCMDRYLGSKGTTMHRVNQICGVVLTLLALVSVITLTVKYTYRQHDPRVNLMTSNLDGVTYTSTTPTVAKNAPTKSDQSTNFPKQGM